MEKNYTDELYGIVKSEGEIQETVSFNYPKYETKGVPHIVWLKNAEMVEKYLEKIIEAQPFRSEFPIVYLRRDEKDSSGRVIRIHLDVFGRTTMLANAFTFLAAAEKAYVSACMIASDEGKDLIAKLKSNPQISETLSKIAGELQAAVKPTSNAPADSLTNIPEGQDFDGPLDLSLADKTDDGKKGGLPFILLPNPAPDEIN